MLEPLFHHLLFREMSLEHVRLSLWLKGAFLGFTKWSTQWDQIISTKLSMMEVVLTSLLLGIYVLLLTKLNCSAAVGNPTVLFSAYQSQMGRAGGVVN